MGKALENPALSAGAVSQKGRPCFGQNFCFNALINFSFCSRRNNQKTLTKPPKKNVFLEKWPFNMKILTFFFKNSLSIHKAKKSIK